MPLAAALSFMLPPVTDDDRGPKSSWGARNAVPQVVSSARETEREWALRAKQGDRAALAHLCREYGPVLYRSVLLPRLGSEALAKDALSETYARVVEHVGRFAWQESDGRVGPRGGFYAWMRTIAMRIAIDILRARKRVVVWDAEDIAREVDASDHEPSIDIDAQERHDRDVIRAEMHAALDRIHPRYAKAVRRRILEEVPRDRVAAEMEVTPATFDVLLHRAVTALKRELEKNRAQRGQKAPSPATAAGQKILLQEANDGERQGRRDA